jgi:hypothetical protein
MKEKRTVMKKLEIVETSGRAHRDAHPQTGIGSI